MWVGVGTVALLVVVTFDYRSFVRAAPALYLVGLGLLTTVFVLGAWCRERVAGYTWGHSPSSPPSSSS
jgi:hypothetical protein